MARRAWALHLAAVLGYVVVAVAFSWPLLPNAATHLTGDPGGDTGVYVWNQWVFQHGAFVEGRNPLTTEHIFSLTPRPVDLSQHNYTLFLNVLAMPFIGTFGPVLTFNLVYLAVVVLTAWMTFVLARRVTDGAVLEAWLAGLAFAWAPLMVARTTGHVSLVAAAPLPAFMWCLYRVERSERLRDSALAGVVVAWAAFCDAYYAVYCLMIATVYVGSRVLRLEWRRGWHHGVGRWILDLCILLTGGLVAGLALGRGGRLDFFGIPVSVRGLYTPTLLLTLLVLARLVLTLGPHVARVSLPSPRAIAATLVAGFTGAVVLSPALYGASQRLFDGTWVSPPIFWRSSPAGVDLLAFVVPNPSHPLVSWLAGSAQLAAPTVFVEYTAALSLMTLAAIAFAIWRLGLRNPGLLTVAVGFALLALGPFVHVAGVNTYAPGPWALLRYVPVFGLARTPTRFAIVAALAVSLLFALALVEIGRRWPHRRRVLLGAIAVALVVELWPAPRPLYSAGISPVYDIIRADPRPVRVLELPTGVRDGTSSAGNFSARYQFHQTVHGKRLMGGYLSRVSERRLSEVKESRTLAALIALSQGDEVAAADLSDVAARAPGFVQRARLGWVVIHRAQTPPALEAFVTRAFALERVAEDGDTVLFRPRLAPSPDIAATRP
ncbi:MAG: hypothetical protein AB7H93_12035 [Vicinamibacterales bacterium]